MTIAILINSPSFQFSITYREGIFTVCGEDWFRDDEEVFEDMNNTEDIFILVKKYIHTWASFSLIEYDKMDAHSELLYNEVFFNLREVGEKGHSLSECINMLESKINEKK